MKKFMENSIKRVMGNKKNADKKKLKGFTLVEIIVVLVILAILAAAMIPALTGYIDKANQKTAISEARNVVTAAQTLASEKYALGGKSSIGTWETAENNKANTVSTKDGKIDMSNVRYAGVLELADIVVETEGSKLIGGYIESLDVSDNGKIATMTYVTTKGYEVVYENGKFTTPDEK